MRHPILEADLERIAAFELPWERFESKTVLVSGANGFLPAYMIETLLFRNERIGMSQKKTKVIGLVRNVEKARRRFSHYEGRSDLTFLVQDITDPIQTSEFIHFIIHAASQASPKYFGVDPIGTINANVIGTTRALELAQKSADSRLLFFSSGEVYGEVTDSIVPTGETQFGYLDPMNVRSCYGESKRLGETICASWHKQNGVDVVVARPFHTYGPSMNLDDGRVYADFVADIVNRRNITLRSDGAARRAFCYLADATAGFFTVLLRGVSGVAYNVGNPSGEISISELADLVANLLPDRKVTVVRSLQTSSDGYLRSNLSRNSPNISRIAELGWAPTTNLVDGFSRTIRSFL